MDGPAAAAVCAGIRQARCTHRGRAGVIRNIERSAFCSRRSVLRKQSESHRGHGQYGQPDRTGLAQTPCSAGRTAAAGGRAENVPVDPRPDYGASDEAVHSVNWFAWILRGVYPPAAMPAQ